MSNAQIAALGEGPGGYGLTGRQDDIGPGLGSGAWITSLFPTCALR